MGLALALLAYWADQRWGKRTAVPSREEAVVSAVSAGRLPHLEDGEGVWAHGEGVTANGPPRGDQGPGR
jgi:hypothetical protein